MKEKIFEFLTSLKYLASIVFHWTIDWIWVNPEDFGIDPSFNYTQNS